MTDTAAAQEGFISIPSAWELGWVPLDSSEFGNVPGPCWKVLRDDAAGGSMTYVIHIPPGWRTGLHWHPAVEEVFKLAGSSEFPGNLLEKWSYLYRPPGILHGPAWMPTDAGNTSLTRMSGELKVLHYEGDEFPHANLQPITDDHKTWPIEWNENVDLMNAPWVPVEAGGWEGASVRRASRNKVNGGGALMIRLPAGWSGAGSPARGRIEEFVVEGSMVAGGVSYCKWGYMCRPQGMPAAEYSTEDGAVLFCYWDEADELAA